MWGTLKTTFLKRKYCGRKRVGLGTRLKKTKEIVRTSLIDQLVKNPPAMQETPETVVRFLGREDPLEKG